MASIALAIVLAACGEPSPTTVTASHTDLSSASVGANTFIVCNHLAPPLTGTAKIGIHDNTGTHTYVLGNSQCTFPLAANGRTEFYVVPDPAIESADVACTVDIYVDATIVDRKQCGLAPSIVVDLPLGRRAVVHFYSQLASPEGIFELCSVTSGAPTHASSFFVTVDVGNDGAATPDQRFTVTLPEPVSRHACADIWRNRSTRPDRVTVREIGIAGFSQYWSRTTFERGAQSATLFVPNDQSTGIVKSGFGHRVVFYDVPIGPRRPSGNPGPRIGLPDPSFAEVCVTTGSVGTDVILRVTASNAGTSPPVATSFDVRIGAGQCRDVWVDDLGGSAPLSRVQIATLPTSGFSIRCSLAAINGSRETSRTCPDDRTMLVGNGVGQTMMLTQSAIDLSRTVVECYLVYPSTTVNRCDAPRRIVPPPDAPSCDEGALVRVHYSTVLGREYAVRWFCLRTIPTPPFPPPNIVTPSA